MPVFTIGRSEDCHVCIDDDSVSRSHATIEPKPDGTYVIRDLQSSNGTYRFVNGNFTKQTQFAVRQGDSIKFGEFVTQVDDMVGLLPHNQQFPARSNGATPSRQSYTDGNEPSELAYAWRCVSRHYADFSGRARRKEFWFFMLFSLILFVLLGVVDYAGGLYFFVGRAWGVAWYPIGIVSFVAELALALPALAVQIRRLHDTDRSGWWVLLTYVPLVAIIAHVIFRAKIGDLGMFVVLGYSMAILWLIGTIWLIVLFSLKGTERPNQYGDDPTREA